MSLSQKLVLFSLLLVTGTGWTVLALTTATTDQQMLANELTARAHRAAQLVDVLGEEILREPSRHQIPGRTRVGETLRRVLSRSDGTRSIYSVAQRDGRSVVVQEFRRDGETRPSGTPLPLPHEGYRAQRTHSIQTHVIVDSEGRTAQTFAPVLDGNHEVLGLIVVESALEPAQGLGSLAWIGVALSLFSGLVALSVLLVWVGRPLERMQDQLVAKRNISPKTVRNPSDLLREFTLVIDKALSDREYFDAFLKQQDRTQASHIRRKDEVIANTVHELRTPLTSIIASLEIMIDNEDMMTADEKSEFIAQAATAGRHMMFIVNDMLDASAIDAGQIKMHIENCNMQQVLEEARRSMELVATARAMTLVVEEIDPEMVVMADTSRFMQVIFNLVSNAVKYTPSGSTITIRAWPSKTSVIVEVEDEGESIPVEMRTKLFTRFSKLEREESGHTGLKSSGLGLYLTKKLVELMGGTVGYRESDKSDGSVFWFTLPTVEGQVLLPVLSE